MFLAIFINRWKTLTSMHAPLPRAREKANSRGCTSVFPRYVSYGPGACRTPHPTLRYQPFPTRTQNANANQTVHVKATKENQGGLLPNGDSVLFIFETSIVRFTFKFKKRTWLRLSMCSYNSKCLCTFQRIRYVNVYKRNFRHRVTVGKPVLAPCPGLGIRTGLREFRPHWNSSSA